MTADASNLAQTIVPKSDQLNADDLLTGPLTVTVTGVQAHDSADQPVSVNIAGHRPYKPCKSMRRVLITAWGVDGRAWAGRSMTLYCDPEVMFGGIKVGGIRISHLSHIDRELALSLTATRGKKANYKVKPLATTAAAPYPEDKFAAGLPKWRELIVAGKNTPDQIIAKAEQTSGRMTEDQKRQIRACAATSAAFDQALRAIETAADLDALISANAASADFPPHQFEALKAAAAKRHDELMAISDNSGA
jgi:hypothetical protein